jgi:hypothetical protein
VLLSGCNTAAEWPGCSRGGSAVENAAKKNKANDAEIHPSPRFAARWTGKMSTPTRSSPIPQIDPQTGFGINLFDAWRYLTLFPGQDPQAATQP